jgi:hypothetical protein
MPNINTVVSIICNGSIKVAGNDNGWTIHQLDDDNQHWNQVIELSDLSISNFLDSSDYSIRLDELKSFADELEALLKQICRLEKIFSEFIVIDPESGMLRICTTTKE